MNGGAGGKSLFLDGYPGGTGGFGGGGGGGELGTGGGGGGGYTGGDGAAYAGRTSGGTSFNAGVNPQFRLADSIGDGLVAITLVSEVPAPAPVPEPTSLALLGAGLASLLCLRLRTAGRARHRNSLHAASSRAAVGWRGAVARQTTVPPMPRVSTSCSRTSHWSPGRVLAASDYLPELGGKRFDHTETVGLSRSAESASFPVSASPRAVCGACCVRAGPRAWVNTYSDVLFASKTAGSVRRAVGCPQRIVYRINPLWWLCRSRNQ